MEVLFAIALAGAVATVGVGVGAESLTWIASRPRPHQLRTTFGDPILDGALSIAGDPKVLGPALRRDDARAAAMAVLHAHPDSRVTATHVLFRTDGRLMDGLTDAIEDCVALARALGARPASAAEPGATTARMR